MTPLSVILQSHIVIYVTHVDYKTHENMLYFFALNIHLYFKDIKEKNVFYIYHFTGFYYFLRISFPLTSFLLSLSNILLLYLIFIIFKLWSII